MRSLAPVIGFLLLVASAAAQPWLQPPYLKVKSRADTLICPNFYEVRKAFNRYEKQYEARHPRPEALGDETEEGKFAGYNPYKRWEWYMEQRVYPSGDMSLPGTTYQAFQEYLSSKFYNEKSAQRSVPPANWTAMGPTGTVTNGDFAGAGRVNFIRLDPVDPNIMWTGSPTGGLWKSTNGGGSWSSNTDMLSIIGVSDVVIDPSNTQIMYLATGDANGTTSQLTLSSIGVLKSTDGGMTWPAASNTMNWDVSWNRIIYKLLIHPTRPDTVYAATNVGIFRTLNAGMNWTLVQSGQFTDMEFKPGNPNVIYATSGIFSLGTFYKSVNAGGSFTEVTSGLPANIDVARLEVEVTPSDTNLVYLVAVRKNTYDFYGFYRSTDGGDQFTLRANTPNILFGSAGSQAWYNLCMAVSPLHKDTVIVGATNLWRTTDGGLTWVKHSSENGGFIPYVHPDHHAIKFLPGNDAVYFSGNDGGIFKTTNYGASWTTMNTGLQITQMYKIGISPLNSNNILAGLQDMATQEYENGNWTLFTPNTGDGMECIYEYDNDTIRYLESYKGYVRVTYNDYPLFNTVCTFFGTGVNGIGSWITPMVMHPYHDSTLLIGKAQIWRTTNGGQTFTQVGNVSGGDTYLKALAYAPSDPAYIYAAKKDRLFVATDGNTFIDRTGNLPVSTVGITAIAVSNMDPKKVWVTFSGYSATNKVWRSTDAGLTWSSLSNGLPNLPVNCITYQHASNDGLYIGTDVGVFFIDNSYSAWQPYFTGLPNVDVEELEIAYDIGKIRAATNGRGLWQSDLAVPVPSLLTWVGTVSSDWNNPLNWSPPAVPTIHQDAVIPMVPATNFQPTINAAGQTCRNLTLYGNANVTVSTGKLFKVKQTISLQ